MANRRGGAAAAGLDSRVRAASPSPVDGYGASTYGDRWADVYDAWVADRFPPGEAEDAADFLADLAGGGPALELAIGTGRVALPLVARSVEVHGIDASEAMVAKLREKPGGADIPVWIGDFADVGVEGTYPLIYVVFNTFFALLSQEDQLRCMRNAARHLTEGGAFVVEVFVPDVTRFVRGQNVEATRVGADTAQLDVSRHDPVDQRIVVQSVFVGSDGIHMRPVQLRYAWPSELDLMGRLAGLRLRERWDGWRRGAFRGEGRHVSVYERVTT